VDDIVDGIVGVRVVLVVRVRVNLVEERQQQGLDWGLTTKHIGGTVVAVGVVSVGRAIALGNRRVVRYCRCYCGCVVCV